MMFRHNPIPFIAPIQPVVVRAIEYLLNQQYKSKMDLILLVSIVTCISSCKQDSRPYEADQSREQPSYDESFDAGDDTIDFDTEAQRSEQASDSLQQASYSLPVEDTVGTYRFNRLMATIEAYRNAKDTASANKHAEKIKATVEKSAAFYYLNYPFMHLDGTILEKLVDTLGVDAYGIERLTYAHSRLRNLQKRLKYEFEIDVDVFKYAPREVQDYENDLRAIDQKRKDRLSELFSDIKKPVAVKGLDFSKMLDRLDSTLKDSTQQDTARIDSTQKSKIIPDTSLGKQGN